MIYWHLPDPAGSYENSNGERCNVFSAQSVDFPSGFSNFCEAEILGKALQKLGLTLIQTAAKRYSQFALKKELMRRKLWTVVKEAMTEDEYESFILADYLAADNPLFAGFLTRLQLPDIADILAACEI